MAAFLAGLWELHWTKTTVYWFAKPRVHVDNERRLHREDGPALESDCEDLFFIDGVLLPEHAVLRPAEITLDEIRAETNAEARRILRQRYGEGRYIMDARLELLDADFEGYPLGAAPRALVRDLDGSVTLVGTDGSTARPYYMPLLAEAKPRTCREAHETLCGFSEERIVSKS